MYETPDLKTLSEIACVSEFHLHRIFKGVMGENIGEFVARLRLEDIAQRLRMSEENLDTIAEKTGYSSKNALSKAFKKHFGTTPSTFRTEIRKKDIADYSDKQVFLEPKICEVPDKNLAYIRIVDFYGSPKSYHQAWKELGSFAIANNLLDSDSESIGLSWDDPTITPPEQCRFYACLSTCKTFKSSGKIGTQVLQGGLFAVFTLKGPYSGLIELYKNIYSSWITENNKYKLRKGISYEKYLNHPEKVAESEILTEIYIPIKKIT